MRSLKALIQFAIVLAAVALTAGAEENVTLVVEQPQVAGICGFRTLWDTPLVLDENGATEFTDSVWKDKSPTAVWSPAKRGVKSAAIAFDALQRSMLVRFPDCAEKIAEQIAKGYAIKKAELVLPFKDTELWPPGTDQFATPDGYLHRRNWDVDKMYRDNPPQWHALAWVLRKPWNADGKTGPTYNAFINGAGYWAKYGAQDTEKDRYPKQFGPAEVSYKITDGRIDVTAALTDETFGATPGQRLRQFADNGLIVRKLETYDHRYFRDVYEWATSTGGRGILISTPKLSVEFTKSGAQKVELPPATDFTTLTKELQAAGGRPTAVMPTAAELEVLAKKFEPSKPAWMPDWQWQRVHELAALHGGEFEPGTPFWYQFVPEFIRNRMAHGKDKAGKIIPATSEEIYGAFVDSQIGKQPRGWYGFEAADTLLPWYLYKDAMPAPAQDNWLTFWNNWLMPDRAASELVHPQNNSLQKYTPEKDSKIYDRYYAQTGDWRGNKSFYRVGYIFNMSTMNFNHTAAMGCLLGGNIIGSDVAMKEGRYGLENFPLRLWSWFDGSTQESIDHYYLAITLRAQKMLADFGPSPFDRMVGRSMLGKTIDEIASSYHPGLKRMIAGSSRTSLEFLLVKQDGLQYILNTLSHAGTLHDTAGDPPPARMAAIGYEFPPDRVAQMSMIAPWAPDWVANTVDEKPLPFQMTNTYKQWGGHSENPMMRRVYLGHHYGLASTDLPAGRISIMAQWRREDKPADRMQDIVTMNLRYGMNTTQFVNAAGGWIEPFGSTATFQHKNKMIVVTSPYGRTDFAVNKMAKEGLSSLQSTLALYNFQPQPTWEIYVDGQRVTQLPFKAKALQRITIKDGVTYMGVIPLPATDLGRTDEVTLEEGKEQEYDKLKIKAALLINSYNFQTETPLKKIDDWNKIDQAYGGFAVEIGDATEYADFAAFERHFKDATLETRWEAEKQTLHVSYKSGNDLMEMGALPAYPESGKSPQCFAYRKLNGQWPYLPKGIDRDTTLAQQGTTGLLEKNGAVLACEPGRMAYLQTEPVSGTYSGFNPFPDPTLWSLTVPGGISVKADGRLGMARVTVRPKENKVWIDYALKENQTGRDMATSLLIFGLKDAPLIELNGKPVAATQSKELNAIVVPLVDQKQSDGLEVRFRRAEEEFAAYQKDKPDLKQSLIQDWYVAGPFPNEQGAGFDTEYGPEKELKSNGIDVKSNYESTLGAVAWQRLLAPEKPPLGEGYIDLLPRFKPNVNVCAYTYTTVTSDRDRDVTLYAGSDDTITAWVNGERVLAKNVYRGATMDSDRAEIKLRKGANTILLKICQGDGGWGFFCRLGDEFGLPIKDGVKFGF